jgi:hypothetical protein
MRNLLLSFALLLPLAACGGDDTVAICSTTDRDCSCHYTNAANVSGYDDADAHCSNEQIGLNLASTRCCATAGWNEGQADSRCYCEADDGTGCPADEHRLGMCR